MELMIHSPSFLLPTSLAANSPPLAYVLVILNRNLPRFTPLLWEHAQLRICADGGANRLYDELPLLYPDEADVAIRNRYTPDLIKGDMDSIREDVLGFYKDLLCILVAGALGGRFDHEIGNINVPCYFSSTRIILLSDDCLIQLLPSIHHHEIRILTFKDHIVVSYLSVDLQKVVRRLGSNGISLIQR